MKPTTNNLESNALAGEATARLHPWNLLHSQADRLHSAHVLTGWAKSDLQARADYLLLTSDAVSAALESMDSMIRTLNTVLEDGVELSMMSVRGPILWSETLTARAHSFGSEDVYMCRVTTRTFNTAENRFMLSILKALVTTHQRLQQSDLWHDLHPAEQARLEDNSQQARQWAGHTRLSRLSRKPISPREIAAIRHSPRHIQFAPFVALYEQRRKLFTLDELNVLMDQVTQDYLGHVQEVSHAVASLTRQPARWSVSDAGLHRGELTFRHPKASGVFPSGVAFRGVVVPADDSLEARFNK